MVTMAIPSVQWSTPADCQPRPVWDKRFDSKPVCPSTAELDVEYNALVVSWKRFQELLDPAHHVDFCPHPQVPRDVVALVRSVQSRWRSSLAPDLFTRACALADRLVATLDAHPVLLLALSDHDSYASLFYAVLQSLIKASENYPKVVEGLLKALVKVNESICLPVGGKRPSPPVADNNNNNNNNTNTANSANSTNTTAPQVARFYSLTFFLLTEFMDWYVRRSMCRLLTSPSQEVYPHFQNLVCAIRARGLEVMREFTHGVDLLEDRGCAKKRRLMHENASYLWEEARMEQVGRQGPDRHAAAQNTAIRKLIWELQDHDAQRARMRLERDLLLAQWFDRIHALIRPLPDSLPHHHPHSHRHPHHPHHNHNNNTDDAGIACLTTKPAQDLNTSRFSWSYGSRRKYTRIELQSASAHLQDYFESEHQLAPVDTDVEIVVEPHVVNTLRGWATKPYSQVLAMGSSSSSSSSGSNSSSNSTASSSDHHDSGGGENHNHNGLSASSFRPTPVLPTPVALISACYACFAHQARLPVISHFCSLPARTRDNMTPFEQGLIALAYSLVRQLIDCLPPVVNSDVACHLGSERFRFLDGTLNCWKEVLSLIDRLIYHAPPLLLCVIDGLDLLHDASTDAYIRSLVRVLLTHTRHETVPMPDGSHRQRVLFKVLFTVTGRPSSLLEPLAENQHILSESNRVDPAALADATMISDP